MEIEIANLKKKKGGKKREVSLSHIHRVNKKIARIVDYSSLLIFHLLFHATYAVEEKFFKYAKIFSRYFIHNSCNLSRKNYLCKNLFTHFYIYIYIFILFNI